MCKLYPGAKASLLRRKPLLTVVFLLYSVASFCNVYNVSVVTDGNATNQLRGAILAASAAGAGPHTINVAAGTYNLTMGEISFGNSVVTISIVGAGAASTIINMTTTLQDRIFLINPPGTVSNVQVSVSGISFNGGHLKTDNFGGGAILCGGPNNTVNISNCIFSNNTIDPSAGTSGGAIAMEGGGTLTIDQCVFTGNSITTGNGGALFYFLPNTNSGSLQVTNSSFSNNHVSAAGSAGGAIFVSIQGILSATTSAVSIQKNSFSGNGATANGGAISITNSFSTSNTAFVNYNRFTGNAAGNTATSGIGMAAACEQAALLASGGAGVLNTGVWLQLTSRSASPGICSGSQGNATVVTGSFLKNSAGASIPVSNLTALIGLPISFSGTHGSLTGAQSTVQPGGEATVTFISDGTTGLATVNPVADNVPVNDATAKTSIFVAALPSITTQPVSTTACAGNSASFSVVASGASLSYQWYNGAGPLPDGPTVSGSSLSGTATATLTIQNAGTADNAAGYYVTASNTCQSVSGMATLAVSPLAIAGANASGAGTVSANNPFINDGSCNRIARVLPAGASPVTGTVNAQITIDGAQSSYHGQPYVKRHYDIAPAANAATATATITLYALQSEFDSYNAVMPGTANDLPTGPSDATGIANLRVTQYHGAGTVPGNYTGWTGSGPAAVLINPGASNVQWNSATNYWEISFDVTGFSGFYITGLITSALPVKLESFTAVAQPGAVEVQWTAGEEINVDHYEIERSTDGQSFSYTGRTTANHSRQYDYRDANPLPGLSYYRLKIIDHDGGFSYSAIAVVSREPAGWSLQAGPNPFHDQLRITVYAPATDFITLNLLNLAGSTLIRQKIMVQQGANTFFLPMPGKYSNGTYLLRIENHAISQTIKIVKAN